MGKEITPMLKFLGVGLSRTGTTTLTKTLNDAGLKVFHYPTRNQVFGQQWNGLTDISVIPLIDWFKKSWPNGKWVCTYRDKEDWLNRVGAYITGKDKVVDVGRGTLELRKYVYGSERFDYKIWGDSFDKHHERLKKFDNILFLNIVAGDKPKILFDFLGLENPPEEFKKYNAKRYG
jgi:hypothetical protein